MAPGAVMPSAVSGAPRPAEAARTISVLMTVFNTQAYLREAIDSILTQTFTDFELIIIDDASTDDSWAVIEEAASRDSRVRPLRRAERGGASSGLNLGLAHARGQYITRQDSDDVSLPTRLAEQIAFLDAHPDVGCVGTAATIIDADGRAQGHFPVPAANREIQTTLLDRMCLGPHVLIRRSAFEDAGLRFDESLSGSEDYDICLRLAEVTTLANLEAALYLYRHHAASVSHRQRYRQLRRKALALGNALHRRHGVTPPPELMHTVVRDFVRAAVLGHAAGDAAESRACIASAVAIDPLLRQHAAAIESVVRMCATPLPAAEAVRLIETLFSDLLPRTARLGRLRRRLLADVHMREVFAAARDGHPAIVRRHLWPALRRNPAWLASRGVLSLIARHALAPANRAG